MTENEHYILQNVSRAALYEQLAEECAELAQAALKASRYLRKENPTPKSKIEIMANIVEESSDVVNCLNLLCIQPHSPTIVYKNARWTTRLKKGTNK